MWGKIRKGGFNNLTNISKIMEGNKNMYVLEKMKKEEKLENKLRSLNYVNESEGEWFFKIGNSYRTNLQTSYKKDFEEEERNNNSEISILRTRNYIEHQNSVINDFFKDFIENYRDINRDRDIKIDEVVMLFEVTSKTILDKFFDNIDYENSCLLRDFFWCDDYDSEKDGKEFHVVQELRKHIKIRDERMKEKINNFRRYLENGGNYENIRRNETRN